MIINLNYFPSPLKQYISVLNQEYNHSATTALPPLQLITKIVLQMSKYELTRTLSLLSLSSDRLLFVVVVWNPWRFILLWKMELTLGKLDLFSRAQAALYSELN